MAREKIAAFIVSVMIIFSLSVLPGAARDASSIGSERPALYYGSQYIHEGAVNVDISAVGQGVYVKIITFTAGLTNGVEINSGAFNVNSVGTYKAEWQISGDSAGNNKDYEVDVFINGIEQDDASARRDYGGSGSLGSMSGTGIFQITDTSHDIDIRVKEIGGAGGTDFDIFNMNFNILQIGGL